MKFIITLLSFLFCANLSAQAIAKKGSPAELAFQKEYQKNIKLSKIRGVYIPATVDEALARIQKLSPPSAMSKFQTSEESTVCKKLHYGIGRWMIQNWNFYTGSRLSHLLKSKGVLHPDDMAQFLLRTLHRKLNNNPLDEKSLVDELGKERKEMTRVALGL